MEVYCPFPVRENPHGTASEHFLRGALRQAGADDRLGEIGIGRLAALAYPDAEPAPLQIATLWFAFFWLFDDAWADRLPVGSAHRVGPVHRRVAAVLSGTRPTAADHPSVRMLGVLLDAIRCWKPEWDAAGFHREVLRYLQATLWEVEIRRRGTVPSLSDYLRMRPLVAAVPPSRELDFLICDLRLDHPLRTHPCVELADAAAGNYSCWVNDLCSLDTERGSGMNLVTVARHEFGWSQRQAVDWVTAVAGGEVATFQALRDSLPRTVLPRPAGGELDHYLDHYKGWFVASARWMPRTSRYQV